MNPSPFDPPFRWHVPSISGELPYLVDTSANNGMGQCGCRHHTCKRQPAISSGTPVPPPCRHIQIARKSAADLLYRQLLESQGLPDEPQFRGIGEFLLGIATWRANHEH